MKEIIGGGTDVPPKRAWKGRAARILKAALALARRLIRLVAAPLRRVVRVIERAIAVLSDAAIGTPRRQFFLGSVVVPLLVTAIPVYVGARLVSEYQDWQDRRSRIRDNIESLQEAATTLGSELDSLTHRAGVLEKNRGKGVIGEEGPVKVSLARIESMSRLLTEQAKSETIPRLHASLPSQVATCRSQVDDYMSCVMDRLQADPPAIPDTGCTDDFKRKVSEKGSCRSLELTAYSIVF